MFPEFLLPLGAGKAKGAASDDNNGHGKSGESEKLTKVAPEEKKPHLPTINYPLHRKAGKAERAFPYTKVNIAQRLKGRKIDLKRGQKVDKGSELNQKDGIARGAALREEDEKLLEEARRRFYDEYKHKPKWLK